MTASTDLDLGLSYDEVAAEQARDNRPSFNHNPIIWEGDLVSITRGSEMFTNGQEYPRHAFNFTKCKFVDTGNAMNYQDGDDFTLLVQPIEQGKAKRFSQLGKSTLASGANLDSFVGSRVRVTEITETYKSKDGGYDRQSYSWRFEKIGEGKSTAAATEPTELGIATATALLNGPAKDKAGEPTGNPWTLGDYAYWAAKTPGIDFVLMGLIAEGKWEGLAGIK